MSTRKLSDMELTKIVKLKETDGSLAEFYVVSHNYETELNGTGKTLLLRKKLWNSATWDGSDNYPYGYYKSRLIDSCNSYFGQLSSEAKAVVISTRIRSITDSDNTAERIITLNSFSLSASELKLSENFGGTPSEGTVLPNYSLYKNDDAVNSSGVVRNWWTRSPHMTSRHYKECFSNNDFTWAWESCYIRPALSVLSDSTVLDDGTIVKNSIPNTPSGITIPDTIRGGEDCKFSWVAATDPDGNLDGYIVERSYNGGSSWSQIYQGRDTSTTTTIPFGTETVMFRVCAYDTYGEKSGWRTSENRTVVNNRAPAAPPSISVPLKPAGGEKLTVTWTASTDADGNLEGYELERQWDGAGAFTQIYKGAGLSYQDSIPKGEHTSVVYRVRAYDSFASYSSYTTSPSRTIDNNTAPVIACDLSGDLGEKSEGFTIPYTVSDAEQQEVTVVERVGDLVKRTYKATLDEQATFEVTGEYFQRILNGAQTVQIVATDSAGKSSTLSLTFTNVVHRAVITLSEPLAVEEPITVAVLAITGKIPADATQLIELTNNGNDPEPVWEDATADVKAGRNHPFTNKTQTNGWAFNFRVTVERGESGEDGNIVSIQGGFQ